MNKRAALFRAFLLLLFANVGDAHVHYCLDGKEPAVSFHYENFDGHPDHQGEQDHNDFESELNLSSALSVIKLLNHCLLSTANVCIIYTLSLTDNFILETNISFRSNEIFVLTPPLRAPPLLA